MNRTGQGFTLIELMVTITVLAIFLTIGIPSFFDTIEKQRVRNAVEKVYADLNFARSQAIKANRTLFFTINPGADWCYGIDDTAACDCTVANDCQVEGGARVSTATDFNNTTLTTTLDALPDTAILFDPRRGLPNNAGDIVITSSGGLVAEVRMNAIGRLSICSDQARLGYPACSP